MCLMLMLVQVTSIATPTQLTRLEIDLEDFSFNCTASCNMESLSSLRSLRALILHNSSDVEEWLPACVPDWDQLRELFLPEAGIQKASLQALAMLPSLHTLQCVFNLRRAGHVQLASLQHLTYSYTRAPVGTPPELAAFSAPELRTVAGLESVCLKWEPDEDQDEGQWLVDLARVADGILQWVPALSLHGSMKGDALDKILSALHRWQPVQGGQRCWINLASSHIEGPASLASLPPVVRCLT
jgi:hypothetical protein